MTKSKPMVILDLTKVPEDWGADASTQEYLKGSDWQYEPPTCYTCGHVGWAQERSGLAYKEYEKAKDGTPKYELFHFDCYCLYKLSQFGKKP